MFSFFFSKGERIVPGISLLYRGGGCSSHIFISFPEGGATPHFSFFTEGAKFVFFSHYQRRAQFPSFKGFEFKETRFHLYIMYFDRLNIILVLKEMKKIINIVKRSGRNPGIFQKARGG